MEQMMSARFPGLVPNRYGTTTEYKKGTFYLSHTVWDDGHEEIEIHRCAPEQLLHSYDISEQHLPSPEKVAHTCDKQEFEGIFEKFAALPGETLDLDEKLLNRNENEMSDDSPSASTSYVQKD
jgi:hypothetical protein